MAVTQCKNQQQRNDDGTFHDLNNISAKLWYCGTDAELNTLTSAEKATRMPLPSTVRAIYFLLQNFLKNIQPSQLV